MFEDEMFPSQVLMNPGIIQQKTLTEVAARTNGEVTIADPNNGFMLLLEANSSIAAQIAGMEERVFGNMYAKRATTADQLYRHMSDFDYLDLMANPASMEFSFIFDRDELTARAVDFNANYKKLVIPANTIFTIGSRKYGIYYPIEIRINIRTGNFLVAYDTTYQNPLHELVSNQVNFSSYSSQGMNVIKITIPIYQFAQTEYLDTIIEESGFNVTYPYTDQFYAARVFTYLDNQWKELAYTLSEDIYDRNAVTAKLKLLADESRIQITIPQIYLSTGQVGVKVKIQLYTTKGAIDVPITADEADSTRVNFQARGDNASVYTAPLDALTYTYIHPNQSRIVGGKSAISFEELRSRVIYGSSAAAVPVTPLDLENYVEDNGFSLTKYQDNLTRRTYYANKKLVMGENTPVPSTVAKMVISDTTIATSDTILSFADSMVTILPTTVFKYTESSDQCTPLTSTELTTLTQLSADAYADELNSNIYTRQPFHLVIYTDDKYPQTKTFNLNTPTVTGIQFVKENVAAVAQMSVVVADVIHNGNGTGGYTLRLGVSKTKELADIDEADLYIVLVTTDRAGRSAYLRATWVSATDTMDVYHADIPTSYHISNDGYLRTTMTVSGNSSTSCDIPLSMSFDVRMLVTAAMLPAESAGTLGGGIPLEFDTGVELIRQTVSVTFGEDLSGEIFNMTDAVWGAEEYATWPEDVYYTYPRDVYETDVNGALVYTVDAVPSVILNKLHSAGDQVLDGNSLPLIQYAAGDIKRDGSGNPIVLQGRSLIYYINAMMLDARLYSSDGLDEIAYLNTISSEISAYTSTVSRMANQLLEVTDLYFRPIRTIGSATFGLGNGSTVRLGLGLGFTIKYYVTSAVMASDALKQTIEDTTASVIETQLLKSVVAITDITKQLRESLQDYIVSVDAVGINGTTVQTLITTSRDVSPIVGLKLEVQADGSQLLVKDISIEWALAE